MKDSMSSCRHENATFVVITGELDKSKLNCSATHEIMVIGHCACGAHFHFLGLPASWLPDSPHPAGSEDDGTDNTTIYLPGLWQ